MAVSVPAGEFNQAVEVLRSRYCPAGACRARADRGVAPLAVAMRARMKTGVSQRLLAFVRSRLGEQRVEFAPPPRPLGDAAFSDVFSLGLSNAPEEWTGHLVLRLYPSDSESSQPRLETAVQNGLAAIGFPAPEVLVMVDDPDVLGRMFMIMRRLPGRPFLRGIRPDRFVRDFPSLAVRWPRTVAELAVRLHGLDTAPVLAEARAQGLDQASISTRRHLVFVEDRLERFGSEGMSDGLAWLRQNEPPPPSTLSVVHGDLWPGNVLMTGRQATGLVDWDRAAVGDRAVDIGFAKAGLALMPAPFPPPPPISQAIRTVGRSIASRLGRAYDQLHPVSDERIHYYEALRCARELAVAVEYRARGREAAVSRPPWDHGVRSLVKHFTQRTGVSMRPPRSMR